MNAAPASPPAGRPTWGALVTGAAVRVGAAIAEALAADGWFVCIHHNRSDDAAAAVAGRIEAQGGRAATVGADLADPAQAETLVGRCAALCGGLTCLVNNASLFAYDDIRSLAVEGWDAHMNVNLRAPALLARDFAASLPAGETGCIVNLLDQKLWNQNPDFLSYTVSKAGLFGLTEALALALAPRVRVCGVAPGLLLPSAKMSRATFERVHGLTPLGYGPTVPEIVAAIRFILATPSFNAQTIVVDGGEHLRRRPSDVQFDRRARAKGASA